MTAAVETTLTTSSEDATRALGERLGARRRQKEGGALASSDPVDEQPIDVRFDLPVDRRRHLRILGQVGRTSVGLDDYVLLVPREPVQRVVERELSERVEVDHGSGHHCGR